MKTESLSKALLLVSALFVAASWAKADTILANGNFSEGKAHWRGDGKTADSTDMTDVTASLDHSGDASGMYIPLSQTKWSSISQIFSTRETALQFSMSYKTSADFALRSGPEGFFPLTSLYPLIEKLVDFPLNKIGVQQTKPETVLVIISDPTQNLVIYTTVPFPDKASDTETASTIISGLMAHEEKTLYIAFPQGYGKVTLTNISLDRPRLGAPPPGYSFHN